MFRRRTAPLVLPLVALGVLAAACGNNSSGQATSDTDGQPAAATRSEVAVTLTDKDCAPGTTTVPAGTVVFTITNKGSGKISEAELKSGDRILGEKENVVPGVPGSFTLNLKPGTYQVGCVGSDATTDLVVSEAAGASPSAASGDVQAMLTTATVAYKTYVSGQVEQLQTATKTLTDAVRQGNLTAAAAAYPAARVYYERVEPVAESFGELDPAIDARADDTTVDQITGFHRLESDIFATKSLTGSAATADKLDTDIASLVAEVKAVGFQPAELANGAAGLLDEVASSKVTGEEERYSHVDLVDFTANIDGAQEAYELLKPALQVKDSALAATLDQRFGALQTALAAYKTGPAPSDVQNYATVPPEARKNLAELVDGLAEPLSTLASVVA